MLGVSLLMDVTRCPKNVLSVFQIKFFGSFLFQNHRTHNYPAFLVSMEQWQGVVDLYTADLTTCLQYRDKLEQPAKISCENMV